MRASLLLAFAGLALAQGPDPQDRDREGVSAAGPDWFVHGGG